MPYDLRDQPKPIEEVILHFGVDLREFRQQQLATQRLLSAKSGVSQSVISMIENGLAEGVRLELLARVAAVLGADLLWRPCPHPPGAVMAAWNGRLRRLDGATAIPGTRRLEPSPTWKKPWW